MNLKGCLLLMIYFLVQDTTAENHRLDTYDINSILVFVNNVHERARSDYRLENTTLEDDKKNNVLKMIFNDLTNILTELNKMSDDPRKILSSGDLISFVASLEKHDLKNGYSVQEKLSVKLNTIFNMSETINSYAEPLLKLGSSNFSGERDMSEFCPSNKSIQPNIEFKFEQPIVLKEYKKFIDNLTIITNNTRRHEFCGQTSSLNHAIFDYHHQVVATYLKEYIMLNFVDIIDGRCYDWNVTPLLNTRRNDSMKELSEIIKLTKKLLDNTSVYIYRCDADYHNNTNGKSYYELERMIQTVMISEELMTTSGTCDHNCYLDNIKDTISHHACQEYEDCWYNEQVYDFCLSPGYDNSRIYDWFKDKKGHIYGENYPHCNTSVRSAIKHYDWKQARWCDYCMCTCIKKSPSDKLAVTTISFRDQVTDISNNMVAVGIRFAKKEGMIHVQIKERKFTKQDFNDRGQWKELENIKYDNLLREYSVASSDSVPRKMELGVDYAHPKSVNFDELVTPKGFVVTGVRFRFTGDSLDNPRFKTGAIELQIRVTPFDYITGELINHSQTHWIAPKFNNLRHQLILYHPDKPTKSPENVIDSKTDQFIKFRASDLRKDAGQSTIPFFDAQDVEGTPEFPLGGVGIVHRGRKGYGGFLAFKIYDLNLSTLLNQ